MERPGVIAQQKHMLDDLISRHGISAHIDWYYTPMAREFTRFLTPALLVYDCMDELSAFAGAPLEMRLNERELLLNADLVFTGGLSLYESKRQHHRSVYAFPSSVDAPHFMQARNRREQPEDQASIPHPRIGFAGVIDERMDLTLLREAAAKTPNWHYVLIGPTCKVDPATLPQAANLHYLGMKPYADLPFYFSGWEIGMLPFALNQSTQFISPTKTPEYLAAGMRVISTPIRDVIRPYGELGLVEIAYDASEFVAKTEKLLTEGASEVFLSRADAFLAAKSWDKTWEAMTELMRGTLAIKSLPAQASEFAGKEAYV
jgi:UDP-galactopyranose mutase